MTLEQILVEAKSHKNVLHKDPVYTCYKRAIQKLNFAPEEYQEAIKKLCEVIDY